MLIHHPQVGQDGVDDVEIARDDLDDEGETGSSC